MQIIKICMQQVGEKFLNHREYLVLERLSVFNRLMKLDFWTLRHWNFFFTSLSHNCILISQTCLSVVLWFLEAPFSRVYVNLGHSIVNSKLVWINISEKVTKVQQQNCMEQWTSKRVGRSSYILIIIIITLFLIVPILTLMYSFC